MAMRTALDVTAHNVANAATPGYHRQEVVFEDISPGVLISRTTTGRGVRVADVRRLYDEFVGSQIRLESGNRSYWEVFNTHFPQIEAVFNDESGGGLAEPLNTFFSSWDEVSQHPEEYASRELLLKNGEYLAERLGSAYRTLEDLKKGLYDEAATTVDEVNELLGQIAELNRKIALAPGVLDLRDQRDLLLDRLNGLVRVTAFEEPNHKVTLLLGGTPLLEGETVHSLSVSHGTDGEIRYSVNLPGGARDVTDLIAGGKLKGITDLRDRTLAGYMDRLNAFAVNLTQEVNARHREGFGLDGATGQDFFLSPVSVTDPSGGGVVSKVAVSDPDALDYHRFQIDYVHNPPEDGGDFTVTDLTTGQVVSATVSIDPTTMRRTLSFSGLEVTVDGPMTADESFQVQVLKNAASSVSVTVANPESVAAARAVFQVDGTNDTILIDTGTVTQVKLPHGVYTGEELAALLESEVENASGGAVDLTVAFNPQVKMFRVENSPASSSSIDILWEDPSTTGGSLFGFSSDTPPLAPGDVVSSQSSVEAFAGAGIPGDNGNALALSALADEEVMAGRTPTEFYRELVSQVGVDGAASERMYSFQDSVVQGLEQKMEEMGGVNLDEEAANLIRFQKSFEAAAKMIQVADELLSTLIEMAGR
ncbi:MAG: flagellar hook-associated protein FlgK [Deltaproteobacteria bacterium]|nr:MAG: flagellar hook-associated protein FlgK [Deltaproteobacteria bacterium]